MSEQRGVLFETTERGIHLTVFCAVDEDLKRKMEVEEQKMPEALPIAGGEGGGGGRARGMSEAMRSHSVQYEHADLWAVAIAFAKAWNDHDAEALSRCWRDDSSSDLVSASGLRATGREEIAALFTPDFAEGGSLATSHYRARVAHVKMLGGPGRHLALVDWETAVDGVLNPSTGMPAEATSCGVAVICERGTAASAWEIISVRPQG
jgi:hypothetical protein